MFSKAFVVLATASAAFATVFVTSPVASTTFTGGKEAVIRWQESGTAPTLAEFGPSKVSIYAGNALQQTLLQTINASIDVSKETQITFTPDASIGPNSNEYFVRIESLSLKDAAQPQYPALAFSAKFTMNEMTGVFTADTLKQIAGQSTAPLAAQQTANVKPASSSSSVPASTSKANTGTAVAAAAASATQTESSAMSVRVGWVAAVLGAVVGVAMF